MLSLLATVTGLFVLIPESRGPAPSPVSPYRFGQIYHKHRASVLRIRTYTGHGTREGSAFLIGADGVLLTTQRLIRDAQRVELVDDRGQGLTVQILKQNPSLNVAVLRAASAGGLPSLRLGRSAPLRKGDWVVGIGRGDDGQLVSRAGCVSQVRALTYVIDAATPPGGAVLDLSGRVVAMALRARGARRALVLGVDAILPMLQRLSVETTTQPHLDADRRSPS